MKPTLTPGERITPENARLLKVGDTIRSIATELWTVKERLLGGVTVTHADGRTSLFRWKHYSINAWTFAGRSNPRKSPVKKKDERRVADFNAGYICACCSFLNSHGDHTGIREALRGINIDPKTLDENDRETLEKFNLLPK